jgi:hypothetical protein
MIQEQVQTNKDLDLPTQQELLAQFRCDEISAGASAEFNEQAKSQKKPIEAGRVVEGLGKMMRSWRTMALGTQQLPLHALQHKLTEALAFQSATTAPRRVTTRACTSGSGPTSLALWTRRSPHSSSVS